MQTKSLFTAALLAALPLFVMAQNNSSIRAKIKKTFTLEDLIPGGSTYFQHSVPANRYLTWWGDECVELKIDRCDMIDKQTATETTLFTLDDVNTSLTGSKLHHLYNISFPDAEQPLALLTTVRQRVLYDWQRHQSVWIQPRDTAATNEDWNARSRRLAYVKGHNLYVTDADGSTTAVSTDGSVDLVYGESVHRDEFGISKGTFWSPDGRLLAFYRMDQSMVSTYPQVDITPEVKEGESRCARLVPDKYPMAGETSHQVTVGIYDPATHQTVYLATGDPTDRYFTNIAWSPDGQTLYLIELNRDQNAARLDAYDAASGQLLGTLFEEKNDKYVEPLHPIQFLPWDNSRFVYQTRKDGYNHLYLYQLTDRSHCKPVSQLTRGTFEVLDVVGFDKSGRSILFTSNESDPIGCGVWAVNMKGRRQPLGERSGWHNPTASASGSYVSDNWSSPEVARRIDITAVQSGQTTRVDEMPDPWNAYHTPEIRVGTLKAADGRTDLYYRLVLPTDFDVSKQYPAIVYVYGGPHAHLVQSSRHWDVRGWDVWMAQQGYVMFTLDNRGSEHRGLDFEQATFRRLGAEEMKDQLRGVDFLKSLPYVDASRIGVHGWSFGGFMTTSLMTTYPDVFKCGVAGGPVIDWKYYEVMYGERYMDTPQTNPEGYRETSLLNKAQNLRGRLLLIYGGNDPTCVPQHTLSFLRACIDAGTHPDLFTYPGDGHNMTGTDRVHLHEHISRYFNDFLK